MAIERAKAHLAALGMDGGIMELGDVSSATVELAAKAAGCEEARICKTLCFASKESGCILVLAAGDARIDNRKFKERFGMKASMCSAEQTLEHTGHAVGGVCPFGLAHPAPVYLDESMKRFDHVFAACGAHNAIVRLTLNELERASGAIAWVDVCKLPVTA